MTDSASGLSRSSLRVLAVGAVTFGASSAQPVLSATAASIGLVLFVWSMGTNLPLASGYEHKWAAIAALTVVFGSLVSPLSSVPDSIEPVRPLLLALAVSSSGIAFVSGARLYAKRLAVGLGLLLVVTASVALTASEWNAVLGTDVYHVHKAAGSAVLDGLNPYTNAVRFLDGSPFAPEGRIIEGYPYPPVVLFTYGLAGGFTDPRLVSVIAWLAVIGWLGWKGARFDHGSEVALGVFLLLATSPIWTLVWYGAWTEPLSLALFGVAAVTWNKRATTSGVALGLALASKQYFVFLAPLVLLHRDENWRRRITTIGLTLAAMILPAVVIDPGAFYDATIGNLTEIGFRPDAQSIPGLLSKLGIDVELPQWAWLATGMAASALIGLRSRSGSLFAARAGLVLGLTFVLGLAFPNYWFLVAGLLGIGAFLAAQDSSVFDRITRSRRKTAKTVRSHLT